MKDAAGAEGMGREGGRELEGGKEGKEGRERG